MGNNVAISVGGSQGHFELNVFKVCWRARSSAGPGCAQLCLAASVGSEL